MSNRSIIVLLDRLLDMENDTCWSDCSEGCRKAAELAILASQTQHPATNELLEIVEVVRDLVRVVEFDYGHPRGEFKRPERGRAIGARDALLRAYSLLGRDA